MSYKKSGRTKYFHRRLELINSTSWFALFSGVLIGSRYFLLTIQPSQKTSSFLRIKLDLFHFLQTASSLRITNYLGSLIQPSTSFKIIRENRLNLTSPLTSKSPQPQSILLWLVLLVLAKQVHPNTSAVLLDIGILSMIPILPQSRKSWLLLKMERNFLFIKLLNISRGSLPIVGIAPYW